MQPTTKSKLKKAALIALGVGVVVGIGIQFIPVKGVEANPPERYKLDAPPEVEAILRESCMECHSHETRWPWYTKLAPAKWLMARDVRRGRSHFNMSEWGGTDEQERQLDKETAWEEIEEGEMPLKVYIYPMHLGARLDDEEKAKLKAWLLAHKAAPKAAAESKPETK
jgi:Haem-binding domain